MTLRKTFRWIGLLILFSALSAGAWYKRFSVVSAGSAKSANESAVVSPVSPAMDANDLLVLRFDNSLNGESGETPTTATGTSFVPGIVGSAINLPANNVLTYQSNGNINALEGTCEFWIKPNWNGNDNVARTILQWGDLGGLVIQKDANPNFRMIVNLLRPEGNGYGQYAGIADWQINQWHHVAYTWSSSNRFVKAYIDGRLISQGTLNFPLPSISNPAFRIGANLDGSTVINAAIDELRISDIPRTDAEIAQHFFSAITVTSLTVEPQLLHLFPGWFWTPKLTAVTNLGTMQVSSAGVNWTSSNLNAAIVQSDGRIKCLAPGNVTLTANIQNTSSSMSILVKAPVLPPEVGPVPTSLAAHPSDSLHTIPVLVLRYLPTADGVNIDTVYDADLSPGDHFPLATLKNQIADYDSRVKFMLEEGSRFRGYNNSNAPHALGYKVVQYITIYEPLPPGQVVSTSGGNTIYRADYSQIFERWDVRQAIENSGVKEIWFWAVPCYPRAERPDLRPESYVSMWESNMSSPTTGDVSNSNRDNADLPIYNKTYVVYSQNVHRTQAEAIHNHGHQLESILSHVNQLRDGNTNLWWGNFARAANNPPARCGNTHFPPNATQDYDYTNLNLVASDILNWQPSGGPTTMVNANTWGNVPYAWPGGTAPPQEIESKWYIFWMQSMAGRGSAIPYNSNRLTNWWQFTADWDAAIQGGLGLYEPGNCSYALSANSFAAPNGGASSSVNVTCTGGCKWIASSNAPWITLTSSAFGNGNGTVNFSIAANSGSPRTGTVAIAGQTFTINQGSNCPTITVSPTNSTFPNGGVGQFFRQTFTATGGAEPYTFSVSTGYPTGFSFNPFTGELSGTIPQLGNYSFTIRATDTNGCFGERTYTLPVTFTCPTITINSTPLVPPNGAVGTPYSATFSASGGTGPYAFSVAVGILPLGLTLNATTGVLSGTPTGGGTYSFSLRVVDANNCSSIRVYSIVISGPCGYVLTPASANFAAADNADFVNVATAPTCNWTAVSNSPWITIVDGASGNGPGLVAYTIAANAGPPRTGSMTITGQTFTVTQAGPCPTISVNPANSTLPAGTVGMAYSQTFTQTGGTGAAAFTVVAGALPTGFALNAATGVLSGTPVGTGTFNFTVRATDANTCTGERSYDLTINQPACPTVSGIAPSNGLAGASVTITGTNFTGVTAVKFSNNITATFNINSATQITASVPAGAVSGPITLSKTGCADVQTGIFTVGSCPVVSISTALSGAQNSPLTVPIQVSDLTGRGVVSYDFTLLFDPTVLSLQTAAFDTAGTLSSGFTITPNTSVLGRITISAFGTTALSGAGTLLNLKFNVVGALQACGDLTWGNFVFNEGSPCIATVNGRVCVVGGTISGTVSYCVTPTTKVAGVTISAAGSPAASATTDSAGSYLLSNLGGGPYTVTSMKTGGGSGITSFDASLVAQHVAGLTTLTSCQQTAGDASNNGSLASFDASLIAQFAAGITAAGSVANTWKFVPANRVHQTVNGNLTGQNFDAVLVGDVSGNWTPSGNSPSRPVVQIPVSLPMLSAASGAGVTIPITVGNLAGQNITAYDLDLVFDPGVLQPQASPLDGAGTLSSGMTLTPNVMTGRLRISAFGISALSGSGTLLNLKFNVVGVAGNSTPLTWQSVVFNEEAQSGLTNGNLTVTPVGNGLQFYPLPQPVRLLETRAGFNGCTTPGAPINAGGTLTLPAATTCAGIPANAQAVTGNITVVPSGAGYLTLFPSSATQPTVANSNFANGEITNNVFTVGLGAGDGAFKIFSSATTEVIVDVTGYYAPPGTGGLYFHPLAAPVRLLETRAGFNGCFAPGTQIVGTGNPNADPNQDLSLQGRSPIPSPCNSIPASAQVLVGNATSVLPSGGGYLTIYPSGDTRPTVASSNYAGSDVINGPFAVKLGEDGKFKIYTFASTHLVVDILGYYSTEAVDANGAGLLFNPLPVPVRLLETRPDAPGFTLTGCTRTNAKIVGNPNAATHTQQAAGFCGLPASAQAVVGNVSVVNTAGAGFLTLFPGNLTSTPLVATSNYPPPATFGYNRHYFVGLSPADGTFKVLTQFTTDLILDASGYFAP
ncbi:MAG TPA: putative Ig domain-containing protein [Blastocatellia bacterium]